jgi:hypothetical protein
VDLVAIDFEQIAVQHDQICTLPYFDGSQLIRAAELERRVSRVAIDQ